MKRILTFLLVVVLLLSYVPATHVLAEDSLLPAPDGESVEPKITEPVEPETPVPSEPIALEPIEQEEPEETEPIELEEPQPTEPDEVLPEDTEEEETDPEIIASDTCGDNLTWKLDKNGLLTISGVGEMVSKDDLFLSSHPWKEYSGTVNEVVIEEGVTSIAPEAFSKYKNLLKVTLPKSLTHIGTKAFYQCEFMSEVNFAEGLTEIGEKAFQECYRLKKIILPDSLKIIGVEAFDRCDSVRELKLGNSVTTIGAKAFYGSGIISKLIIPDSVTDVGSHAFGGLKELKEVKLGKGLTKIAQGMLSGSVKLKTIEIPNNITQIEDDAFGGCQSLVTVVVPDSVRSIGKEAFARCFALHTVEIPASVQYVQSNVFYGDKALRTVYYGGTKAQWDSFQVNAEKAKVHYEVEDAQTHATLTKHIAPTCKKTGKDTYKCTCGYSWTVTLEKAHDWQYTKTVPPACNVLGYDLETCSSCKATREVNKVPADPRVRHVVEGNKCTVCGLYVFVQTPVIKSTWQGDGKPMIAASVPGWDYDLEIYRSNTKNGVYTYLGIHKGYNHGFYPDHTAEPGKYYYYKVRYLKDGYVSKFSAPKKVVCKFDLPDDITAGIDDATGKPKITWTAQEGVNKYYIYRSTSEDGKYTKIKTVTGTTFIDTTAKPGKVYYYGMRTVAKNSAANSDFGVLEDGIGVNCAQPVVKVTIDAASGNPVLTWKKVSGAAGYAVYCSGSETGRYTLLATTKTCRLKDADAPANTDFYYVVVAVGQKTSSNSLPSVPVMVHVPCAQVSIKTANDTLTGKPVITWSPVENAMEYEVFRSTSKKGAYTSLGTTEDASFCDASAVAGKTYYYKVCAIDASGAAGAQSSYKSILCKAAQPQIQVALDENGKPAISWEAAEGAVKYEVYRATSLNGKYSKKTTVKTLSYVDTSAKNGTTYYYRVVAVPASSKAKSSPSQSIAITVPWYV